ncbi:ladderlectin-like [Myripristis murdjan]|uniref:ladderlectin-like n=1 Tax=Myripristis murdjan TaxID=586833 RepID=UPI001175EF54|nr:ladderlectin-like [Myripristis murdjan]
MAAAQQNISLEGRPEEPLAVKEESLEEEEPLAQEMARGTMLSYGVESRSSCPPGWSQHGSRCFIFINSPRSWAQAERYCLHLSANLVSIHSAEEHHFIQELVRRSTGGFPQTWIGATDIFQKRLWFWIDGSKFDFQAWAYGQPDNYKGREACAQINFGAASLWNDLPCNYERPFVCAMKLLSC